MRHVISFATLALIGSVGLVACHRHTYTVGSGGDVHRAPAYRQWQSHWFFGVIGESQIEIEKVCPSGNATVRDEHSLLNSLIAAVIGIVWWPTTVTIYCGDDQPQQATVTLSPEQLRRLARDARVREWARLSCAEGRAELCSTWH